MSYDLQIWSVEPAALDPAEASDRWKTNPAGGWSHHGTGWQIVLNEAAAIAREDVPSAVRAAIPAVRYLTEMHLEGRASQTARRVFRDTAETLALKFQGAVVERGPSACLGGSRAIRGEQRPDFAAVSR